MEEIDLKELFKMFWKRKIQIILITVMFIIIGTIYNFCFITPKYKSTIRLLLATELEKTEISSITVIDTTLNSQLIPTFKELVKSDKIIKKVISNLNMDLDEEEIRNDMTVTSVASTEVLDISVSNEDPTIATKITNEISKVFIDSVKEYYGIEKIYILEEAEVSQVPYNINTTRTIIIFAIIGIIVSSIYVMISNVMQEKRTKK